MLLPLYIRQQPKIQERREEEERASDLKNPKIQDLALESALRTGTGTQNADFMHKKWKDMYNRWLQCRSQSYFVILSLQENVVEDIAQCEDALELKVLIHDH